MNAERSRHLDLLLQFRGRVAQYVVASLDPGLVNGPGRHAGTDHPPTNRGNGGVRIVNIEIRRLGPRLVSVQYAIALSSICLSPAMEIKALPCSLREGPVLRRLPRVSSHRKVADRWNYNLLATQVLVEEGEVVRGQLRPDGAGCRAEIHLAQILDRLPMRPWSNQHVLSLAGKRRAALLAHSAVAFERRPFNYVIPAAGIKTRNLHPVEALASRMFGL